MNLAQNLIAGQALKPLAVGDPKGGVVGGDTAIVVELYALGVGVTVEGEQADFNLRQGTFKLEAAGRSFIFDSVAAGKADGLVLTVESDVGSIGQELQAIDQETLSELACGTVVHEPGSPVAKTAILSLPQGWGKSQMAERLARQLGCARIVEEWCTRRPILGGALHLTNEVLMGGAA